MGLALTLSLDAVLTDEFKIYPNPVNKDLFLKFPNNIDELKVKIFDILGKLVVNISLSSKSNKIDLTALNKGVYILKIEVQNNPKSFKLIKR